MEEIRHIRNFLAAVFDVILQEPDSASRKLNNALMRLKKYDEGPDSRYPNAFKIIVSFVLKIVEKCPKTHHEQLIIDIRQFCPSVVPSYHTTPRKDDFIDDLYERVSMEDIWYVNPDYRMQILDHVDKIIYKGDINALLYILKDKKYRGASVTRIWRAILDIYTDITVPLMKELTRYKYSKFFDWMRDTLDHKRFEELKMYLPTWTSSFNEAINISEIVDTPYNVCRYFKNMFINTVWFGPSQMLVTFFLREDFNDKEWSQLLERESFSIGEGIRHTAHSKLIYVDYPSPGDIETATSFLT